VDGIPAELWSEFSTTNEGFEILRKLFDGRKNRKEFSNPTYLTSVVLTKILQFLEIFSQKITPHIVVLFRNGSSIMTNL
jgi:hypothetical protein